MRIYLCASFTEISLFPMQSAHFSIIFTCPSLLLTTSQGLSISLYHQSVLRIKIPQKTGCCSDKSMLRSTMLIRVLSVLAFKVASKDLNNIVWNHNNKDYISNKYMKREHLSKCKFCTMGKIHLNFTHQILGV